jgi:hypothetical protein
LRRELAVCETYQISHSHYMGGPARWTDLDRAKAEAYAEWRLGTCCRCGTRAEDWDPKQGGHRHAYIADVDVCRGCELLDELREQLPKDVKGADVVLIPNPKLTAANTEEAGRGR